MSIPAYNRHLPFQHIFLQGAFHVKALFSDNRATIR